MTAPTFEKKLIVNGSLNPTITLSEILAHYPSVDDLSTAAWSIIVKLGIYKKVKDLPTYNEVKKNPSEVLQTVWEMKEKLDLREKAEQHKTQLEEGKALYKALKAVPTRSHSFLFSAHATPMSPSQALGYLSEEGENFNNYEATKMARAINEIEALNIRTDFGINNCNTGRENTTYIRQGDYWYVSFSISQEKQDEFHKNYGSQLEIIGRNTLADSVRWKGEKFDATLILWWD